MGLCWSWPSFQWQEALGSRRFPGARCVPIPGEHEQPRCVLLEVHPEAKLEDKSHPVAAPEPLSFPLGSAPLLLSPGPGLAFCSRCSNICSAHQCLSSLASSPRCHGSGTISSPDLGAQAGWGCGGRAWRGGCVNVQHGILALAAVWGTPCSL